MNRRDWFRRAALIAGGVLAADQIELIERLTPRRYVNGWTPPALTTSRPYPYPLLRVGDMIALPSGCIAVVTGVNPPSFSWTL